MKTVMALFCIASATAQQPSPEQQSAKPGAAAESPVPTAEQLGSGYIDFGYRWIPSLNGNFSEYRSVINLGEGPKLLGIDFTILDPKKRLFDRLDALKDVGVACLPSGPRRTACVAAAKGVALR